MLDENVSLGGPAGPHMDVFRAIAHAEMGEAEEAKSIVEGLVTNFSDFPVAKWLGLWIRDDDAYARAMQTLFDHGWPPE